MHMTAASRAAAAALRTAALQGYRRWASSAAHAAAGGAAARVKARLVGDYVPVCVSLGMIALAATMGLHTARHQLANAPNVRLDKRKRETVAEVEDPDLVLHDAHRFLTGSVFRKVAHVQDDRSLAADHHPYVRYQYLAHV